MTSHAADSSPATNAARDDHARDEASWHDASRDDTPLDTLIVGTGTDIWLAPADLRAALRALHVTVDTMQTGPAVRTYNIMMGERRRVAAALVAVP